MISLSSRLTWGVDVMYFVWLIKLCNARKVTLTQRVRDFWVNYTASAAKMRLTTSDSYTVTMNKILPERIQSGHSMLTVDSELSFTLYGVTL